jgi:hypothetical protein
MAKSPPQPKLQKICSRSANMTRFAAQRQTLPEEESEPILKNGSNLTLLHQRDETKSLQDGMELPPLPRME